MWIPDGERGKSTCLLGPGRAGLDLDVDVYRVRFHLQADYAINLLVIDKSHVHVVAVSQQLSHGDVFLALAEGIAGSKRRHRRRMAEPYEP